MSDSEALAAGWPERGGAVGFVRRPDGRVEGRLDAAARLYLEVGFRATGGRERHDRGPGIVYRHYVLKLR